MYFEQEGGRFTITFWLCSWPLAIVLTDSLFGTNQSQCSVTVVCDFVVNVIIVATFCGASGNTGIRTVISCLKRGTDICRAFMNQEIVEFTAFLLHYTAQRDFSLTVSSTDCCASTPLPIQLANTSPWATEFVAWMTWVVDCVVHEIPWRIWIHLSIFKTTRIRTCDFWDKRNGFVSSLEMENVVVFSVMNKSKIIFVS